MADIHPTRPAAAGPAERERVGGVHVLAVLGALSAFGPITTDIYLPSLPRAAAALHTGPAGIQSSLATCLLGLALGQLVAGPISDKWGRRPTLLVGMAVFTLASVLCATTDSILGLDAFRLLQGVAGAAGIAASLAAVRDLHTGARAAGAYSVLMTVTSVAPVLAPAIGGQLLRITDWRGVFAVLAGIGVVLFGCAYRWVAETLPADRRRGGGLTANFAVLPRLAGDRRFMGYALSGGLSFAAMFAYISASAFVFQHVYRVSAQLFAVLFAMNSIGLVLANTANGRLVRRFRPALLFNVGLAGSVVGAAGVLAAALCGAGGLWSLEPPLFLMVSSVGLTQPNATALALDDHPSTAGSASAVLGLTKYLLGAAAAPLGGLGGSSAVPMAVVSLVAATTAAAIRLAGIVRPARPVRSS